MLPSRSPRTGSRTRFTFRDGIKYSDGTDLKASDWEHAIKRVLNLESGGSSFFLYIDGATEYVEKGDPEGDISGIETNDKTGEVTITLAEPYAAFDYVLTMWFATPVPSDTPFENLTEAPPPGNRPVHDHRVGPEPAVRAGEEPRVHRRSTGCPRATWTR